MKKLSLTIIAIGVLFSSCSKDAISDKLDELTGKDALVGKWELVEFNVDEEAAGTYLNLAEDALEKLIEEDCAIVTFEFKEDATLVTENAIDYLEFNAGPTGLIVDCPSEKDIETTMYTYVDGVLKFKDKNGEEISAKASIEADVMTVDAEGLDLPNFNTKGELIFNRK
ncbi:hypothetical protein CLV91_0222 [Maribacter vaceletii]|uniref:Lipocalin-like protein n=1 Tax=Maribacter vaceletii TaxID=1206816 RepID=A0A495EBB6_9FLAO|nr:hypothetical protein [Maribacter vaceletii]RKR14150.1 hypothetical protein CLV91_0222 [Maribacter vaceletii]